MAEALSGVKEAAAQQWQHITELSQGAEDGDEANPSWLHEARLRHVCAHGMQPPAAAAGASEKVRRHTRAACSLPFVGPARVVHRADGAGRKRGVWSLMSGVQGSTWATRIMTERCNDRRL